MQKLLKASGNNTDAFFTKLYANAIKGQNIEKLLTAVSSAPVGGAPAAAAAGGAPAAAVKEGKYLVPRLTIVQTKRKRRKKKKPMSIWVDSLETITEKDNIMHSKDEGVLSAHL